MNKKIAVTAACAFLVLTLASCGSSAEEPSLPNPEGGTAPSGYTLTDSTALESLAVGESAVWRNYEVAVTAIDRTDNQLNVHVGITAHANSQELSADCLLSFGMPPISSTFANNTISVPAGETVSGTLTFDDQYSSQRLFWNDGATEATWLLDKTPVAVESTPQPETPAAEEPKEEPEATEDTQGKAVAAVEASLPALITDNTYYTYQSFDPTTAAISPIEGGYQYVNDIAILDGDGNAATANVLVTCDAEGNTTSLTIDGALVF